MSPKLSRSQLFLRFFITFYINYGDFELGADLHNTGLFNPQCSKAKRYVSRAMISNLFLPLQRLMNNIRSLLIITHEKLSVSASALKRLNFFTSQRRSKQLREQYKQIEVH